MLLTFKAEVKRKAFCEKALAVAGGGQLRPLGAPQIDPLMGRGPGKEADPGLQGTISDIGTSGF